MAIQVKNIMVWNETGEKKGFISERNMRYFKRHLIFIKMIDMTALTLLDWIELDDDNSPDSTLF